MWLVVLQLLSLVVFSVGPGYVLWSVAKRRLEVPTDYWPWFGLAGFYGMVLGLQALVYLDWPVGKTAPFAFALSLAAVARLVWRATREWRAWPRTEWSMLGACVGSASVVVVLHLTSLAGIGREEFIGKGQVDHVNYVTTSQFLKDEPFSTSHLEIGLRPWLVLPLEWKEKRISSGVAVAMTAAISGTDTQEAWGPTAVFFVGLLAWALTGFWRGAGGCGPGLAGVLGGAGAALPAVSGTLLLGFFAQLASLATFPAIAAVLWPRGGARGVAVLLAAVPLGFLAGSYIQFWPIGLSMAGGAILLWRAEWRARAGALAVVGLGSLALTSGYCVFLWDALAALGQDVAGMSQSFEGWVPAGASWVTWGRQFVLGEAAVARTVGAIVVLGLLLAWGLRTEDRWRWLAMFAGPLVLAAKLLFETPVGAYPLHKLQVGFAPICAGWAMLGWLTLGERWRPARIAGWAVAGVLLASGAGSSVADHWQWVRHTRASDHLMGRLAAAKVRAKSASEEILFIGRGGPLVGAWLAYFGRNREVKYGQPAIADRRVPTETHEFRRIAAHEKFLWLDLEANGPVLPLPTVRARVVGAEAEVAQAHRRAFGLGAAAAIELARDPVERGVRRVQVEFGLAPLVGALRVDLLENGRVVETADVARPHVVKFAVEFGAEESLKQIELRIHPANASPRDGVKVLLQALTVEVPEE